jgi:TatD DNase family protein
MIDVHCHLEQKDYDSSRDQVIEKCKKELRAVITSCAHTGDFEKTLVMTKKYKGFVFASYGIHPEYIKEISEKEIDEFIEKVRQNKNDIVAIGEIGLDFKWVVEPEWREKQKELFVRLIRLARELGKPIVVHSRDSYVETMEIMEKEGVKEADMHMFGDHHLKQRVIDNGWHISMNNIMLRSKGHKKIVKDCPIERLMLETDAPWLSPKKLIEGIDEINDPTTIRTVAEKVAEVKKISFDEVWKTCADNAIRFFKLPI